MGEGTIVRTRTSRLENPRVLAYLRTVVEVGVLGLAFVSSFVYRFELPLPAVWHASMWRLLVPVVLLSLVALRLAGAHRQSWRYVGFQDVEDVAIATTSVAAVLLALRLTPGTPEALFVPIGVILANWVLTTVGLCGVRVLRRLQTERSEVKRVQSTGPARRRVLLIGAGRAGVMVAAELVRRPDVGYDVVGFVDDDLAKLGRRVAGLDVLGTTSDIQTVAVGHQVDEVILTMASVSRTDIRRIVELCRSIGLEAKIVPGLFEIVGGQVDLSRIRPVAVEDLLGRDPVELDTSALHELVGGKVVLVTGAGGSIGSELARQAARFAPSRLVLVERSEPALWAIDRELRAAHPHLHVVAAIGDVTDRARVERVFAEHGPSVVVHAAAHKHVPMMEDHPGEAVKNNIGGTKTVVDVAAASDVGHFVLVSTDKAVNPTSVMGATKRVTERYVQHVATTTGRNFVAVRFGNVLGSTGSVVPIFKQQVADGGPVTVTHPDMVRYFMTIPEASGLILQAAALGRSGEILVLDMGEPVRIAELAENVIRMSGFEPGADIDIEFTGLRPGEKMFEELSLDDEQATMTRHPKVWIGQSAQSVWRDVEHDLEHLLSVSDTGSADEVRALLHRLVPQFTGAADAAPEDGSLVVSVPADHSPHDDDDVVHQRR